MELSKSKQLAIWLAWLIIVPAGIWLTIQHSPSRFNGQELDLLAFLILMCVLSLIPMVINNTPISTVQGVSLAVFLVFGLSAEVILTQISFLFMLLMLKLRREEIYRLPLNSILFFFISLLSGLFYYWIGGTHEFATSVSAADFGKIFAYQLAYFVLNTILLTAVRYILFQIKPRLFDKDLLWDCISSLIVVPEAIIMFIVYQQIGYLSILFVGIPLIALALIMRMYNSSQEINALLTKASEFGHKLTQRLEVQEVTQLFIEKISDIVPAEEAYIFDISNKRQEIELLRYAKDGKEQNKDIKMFKSYEGVSGTVWQTGKGIIYSSRKEWQHLDVGVISPGMESILAVPIVRNSLVVGILILASPKKRMYVDYQLMIMDLLCSYLGVAIENARNLQQTKLESEKCALTNLYNYRYFDRVLREEFTKIEKQQYKNLSLILIDIDRFKSVNDTYGHESGNELLVQLADRLDKLIGTRGILARYGGEEFVILIPNFGKQEAYDFAEFIRRSIAGKSFSVHSDLDHHRSNQLVPLTASIGVATAPVDAEDPQALVRHADRAMYTGAKQAGRNKVAQYVG
ncbi:sensor domain-containing diguanylate cyclase [Peribacillus sp. SCS-155]|uniref:sensor domain-containing diguanylate cyclase n=1 Tax=Peribacillus sedimenti TaxID=3115297 RepID=UPI003906BF38